MFSKAELQFIYELITNKNISVSMDMVPVAASVQKTIKLHLDAATHYATDLQPHTEKSYENVSSTSDDTVY
jgi:hypothetical protein